MNLQTFSTALGPIGAVSQSTFIPGSPATPGQFFAYTPAAEDGPVFALTACGYILDFVAGTSFRLTRDAVLRVTEPGKPQPSFYKAVMFNGIAHDRTVLEDLLEEQTRLRRLQ